MGVVVLEEEPAERGGFPEVLALGARNAEAVAELSVKLGTVVAHWGGCGRVRRFR